MANKQLRWFLSSLILLTSAQVCASTQAIDELEPLFRVMKDRLGCMHDVALSKWHNNKNIDDLKREEVVLRHVVEQAQMQGLEPESAEHFFQIQINAAKEIQRGWHNAWLNQQERPASKAPDLTTETRPKISRLGAEIVLLLAEKQSLYSHMEPERLCPKLIEELDVKYLSESTKSELCEALAEIRLIARSSR